MRVLHVINSLGAGGAEHSLIETLPSLRNAGHHPIISCLSGGELEGQLESRRRWDVRFSRARTPAGWIRELRSLIRNERPALIHTSLFEADIAGRLAGAGTPIPVLTSLVNTSYDLVRLDDPAVNRSKLAATRVIDAWTARHLTTHFHAITNAVKDAAVRDLRVPPSSITVIPRGRDPERLGEPSSARRARARRSLGLDGDPFVLLSVGRQEFQKGQWHLLEAMPAIGSRVPEALLLLAGRDGNASGRLRGTAARMSLNGRARFLGHRDDVPEVLAAADLFVFPSLYEGLGGALIEAMALGLPIVASDLPAIREVVEDGRNAVLVPPGSPPALSAAVTDLAEDRDRRRRMGERGREIFRERFTLERSARRMVELFERTASEGRRRR
jgi:glycosyltransferase involved in cell wall biosynthesis